MPPGRHQHHHEHRDADDDGDHGEQQRVEHGVDAGHTDAGQAHGLHGARTIGHDGGDGHGDRPGQQAQREHHQSAQPEREAHQAGNLSGFGGARRPWPGEKSDAVGLHEGEQGQARSEGDHRHRKGHGDGCRNGRIILQPSAVHERLQQQPLGHETARDRQGRRAHGSDPEGGGGERHAPAEAAEPVEVAFPGGVDDGAGAEEQRGLERGVADGEQYGGDERGIRCLGGAGGA